MQRNEESSMALAVAPMQLRVRNRRGLDQVIQLEDRVTIGASTDCSIRLDDADPVHCFIVNGAAGTVLRKWQGEVKLNEQPVQDAWLKPGDVVRIGDNEIRLLGEAPQEHDFISSGNETTDNAAASLRLQTRQVAKNRVAALVQSLRQSRTELASFRDRSNDLGDQISTLKAETATLHQNISAKDATIADLDGQLRDALQHSSTLQKEIESLRQQVDQTTSEFAQSNNEWVEQTQALLHRLNVPADSWPSIQDQGDAPRAYLTLIASSLQSASEAESQVADDSAQLLAELEARQAEVEQRSQQIDEQVRQIEQQHDELQQIRESLDQSRSELETAQTEFASQKESWEVEQHNLIAQFDSVRAAYEQERSAFDVEKSEADSQLVIEREELRQQVEAATEECNELRRQIETLQAEQTEVTAPEPAFDESPANEFIENPTTIDEFATTEFAEETPRIDNDFDAPTAEPESYAAEPDFGDTEFSEPAFQIEEPAADGTEFTDHNEQEENDFTSSMDQTENEFVVDENSEYVLDGGSAHNGGDEYLVESGSQELSAPETFSEPELSQPEPLDAEPAEEIEFSSVNNEAPIDTASILAKYGVSADMDDDEFAAAETPHAEPVQPAAPMATELETMDGNTESDSEDNIDEYMAQLLSRVGGASTQPKADGPQTPSSAEDVVNRSIEAMEQESTPVEEELPPLRPEEFVPRSKAPALDMTSMRSIANETARSAINRHAFKKNRNTLLMQWFMAVCLVIAGVILMMFGTLLTQLGAGLTFVLGIYMGLRAAGIITSNRSMGQKLASIKEKKQKKQRKKKLPKK